MKRDDEVGRPIIEIRPGVMREPGFPGPDESPLETEGRECRHDSTRLNATTREVTCKECLAKLDPFDQLLKISREWDRYVGWVKHTRATRHDIEQEVEQLKRERANLRAQIKRAKR